MGIAELSANQIVAIALSAGPGSFTGLRIGSSLAKGLAYALDVPLIALSTLDTLASAFIHTQSMHNQDNSSRFLLPFLVQRGLTAVYALYTYPPLLPPPPFPPLSQLP